MKSEWIQEPTSDTSVVFVHGILSSGETCWRHENGACWPKLLAREKNFESLGVYVFNYRTDIFSGNYNLEDAVDSLKEHLRLDGLLNGKRIIFVGHSMGGIVVRQFLVQQEADLINREIEIGLFLVASPSLGAFYANLLSRFAEILGNSQAQALQFQQENVWLNALDKNFKNLKEACRLSMTGKELVEDNFIILKRWWRKQVVEPFSGARYFGDPYKVPYSDHWTIAKPEDNQAIQHRLLLQFVREVIRHSVQKTLTPPPDKENYLNGIGRYRNRFVPDVDESVSGKESKPESHWLTPNMVDASATARELRSAEADDASDELIVDYTQVFVGRREEFERITSLVRSVKPGYLHVKGVGGSGKSALIANVIRHFKSQSAGDIVPVLLYYFIRERRNDVQSVLQNVNAQILKSLGAQEFLSTEISQLQAQFRNLWRRLMTEAGQRRPVLLIIDGLDELGEPEKIADWLPGNLVDYVHVVLTSRTGFPLDLYLRREAHIAKWSEPLELKNLEESDIVELLTEYTNDRQQAQQLAPQAMKITNGLPLAARLLSLDIEQHGESALDRSQQYGRGLGRRACHLGLLQALRFAFRLDTRACGEGRLPARFGHGGDH